MTELKIEFKKITGFDDIKLHSELMFTCFGKKAEDNYFKWKYFNNPAGELIAYEAINEGKPVASYGIIPELYTIDGKVVKIYQGIDAMTHPDFQRKGLFVQISKKVYEDALNQEEHLIIITFPAHTAYDGFVKKLEHETIKVYCRYVFVPRLFFNVKQLLASSKIVEIQEYPKVDSELSTYLNHIKPITKIAKYFDAQIFQWKVFDNPNHDYKVIGVKKNNELLGVCVYRIDGIKTCEISWVNFLDKDDYLRYTDQFLKYIFKTTNIRYIYSWEPQQGVLAKAYKKAGFIINSFSKGPFRDTFPFIIYEKGNNVKNITKIFDSYDVQPIQLD
jgi:GNAT superfamily N-acetyltransferase